MNKKKLAIYICIIIVFCNVLIVPKKVEAECIDKYYEVMAALVAAAASSLSTGEAKDFIDKINEAFSKIDFTPCDKNGNPIAVPTTDPNITSGPTPTVDPNATPTPTPDPNAPTPIPGDEEGYADRLVQVANTYCGGVVSQNNENCMENFSVLPMSSTAISVFHDFPHDTKYIDWVGDIDPPIENLYLQCVSCMRGMPTARGRPYTGRGNAKYHANLAVSGYKYYSNSVEGQETNADLLVKRKTHLIPGSLFVSTAGVYGHVGYITKVYMKNGEVSAIKVFECNWGAKGLVSHGRTILINSIAGWQKPN